MKPGPLKYILLFIMVVIAGCAQGPKVPLRIGTNVWPGYEPLYLANEMACFDEATIKLVEYTSATEVTRAFRNSAIDAAALTLDETLQLAETDAGLKVILITDISHGADVVLARPEIKSVKDLKNKRVGIEATALGAYVLTRALQSAGMDLGDIKVVSLEVSEHEDAFKKGHVDAVVTFEPVKTKLIAAGAIKIFDSSRIPGEIVDVLVVRSDYLERNTEKVRKLIEGWFRALKYMQTNQLHAAKLMAKREGLNEEEFLKSLSGLKFPDLRENRLMLAGDPPELVPSAKRLADLMLQQRLLRRAPDVNALLDGHYLKDIRP